MSFVDPSDMNNFVPPHARHVLDQEEFWKPVPGFSGYEVSDRGRLRSYWRRLTGPGAGTNQWEIAEDFQLLGPDMKEKTGHYYYCLCERGRELTLTAARIVLMAFVGLPVDGAEARHVLDPTPANNCLYNLAWGSRSQNTIDKVLHGNHPMVTLTLEDVLQIKRELAAGVPGKDLAERYGVTKGTISHIKNGQTWAHAQLT